MAFTIRDNIYRGRTKTPKFMTTNDQIAQVQEASDKDDIIPIMGPTGSGKSTFINTFVGETVTDVGHGLESCTRDVRHVVLKHPIDPNRRLVLLDTPGFDDTNIDEAEILKRIAFWLGRSYYDKMKLAGIVYLQEITQDRIESKNLEIFKRLCGRKALKFVVLATTKWKRADKTDGPSREAELKETFWKTMSHHGSSVMRFEDTRESAAEVVERILAEKPHSGISLRIQAELVDDQKYLPQTEVGKLVFRDLQEQFAKLKEEQTAARQRHGPGEEAEIQRLEYNQRQQQMDTITLQIQQMKIPLTQKLRDYFRK